MITLIEQKKNKYTEDIDDFYIDLKNFAKTENLSLFHIKEPDLFSIEEAFKICQKKHTRIREFFKNLTFEINIDKNYVLDKIYNDLSIYHEKFYDISISYKSIHTIINDNEYLKKYNIDKKNIISGTLSNGRPLGRHWLNFASKRYGDYWYNPAESTLAGAGALWKGIRDFKNLENLTCVFDTSFLSFIKLGHYNVDNGSCFKTENSHETDKIYLATESNTFVCLLYDDNNIILRCWGQWFKNKWHFTNFYCDKENMYSYLIILFKVIMSNLLNKKYDDILVDTDRPHIDGSIYLNGDSFSIL